MSGRSGRICQICDSENIGFRSNCIKCGNRLERRKPRSKRGKAKLAKKTQSCDGQKVTFKTKKHANLVRKQLFERDGKMVRTYWCDSCKGYHHTKYRN